MKRLSTLLSLVVSGLTVGCAGGGEPPGPKRKYVEPPKETVKRLSLKPFDSCEALEDFLEDGMVRQMKAHIDRAILVGPSFLLRPDAAGAPATADPSDSASRGGSNAAAPSAYTKTNTQVANVDEPDFVKNDGKRIFVLSGQRLLATRSWPPQDLSLQGELTIEGMPREMFLDEQRNRVVVISEIHAPNAGGTGGPTDLACFAGPYACGGYRVTHVKLTVVDVTDAGKLHEAETESYYLPGRYVNARRVGGAVRIVLGDEFRWPTGVRLDPDASGDPSLYSDKTRLTAAYEALKKANEPLIRARTLDEWLPRGRLVRKGTKVLDLTYKCQDFAYAEVMTRMGVLTVATLNLDTPDAQPARTSIVAETGEVFASEKALYVASRHWWWWDAPGQTDWTYLHKFDISSPDRAVYLASGGFEGHIVDQFSMDEHDGHFRVASTIARRVADPQNASNRWGVQELTNRVTVLAEQGGALVPVGQSEELAKGERITSARFRGKVGYVVTFRNVDPLFVFDLRDPVAPKKVGELKIPGFSTYIHPLDEGHLLTIGVFQPEPDPTGRVAWQQRRVQLALFDVTNPAAPRQTHVTLLGTANGWSEAQSEHKAFNYFAERKLLAIPFTDHVRTLTGPAYWETFVSEVRVFDVDVVKGITPRGNVSLRDVYVQRNRYDWTWSYSPWVRRSVMASDPQGQDFVYAISDAGIRVANAASLATPLATTEFPLAPVVSP